VLYDGGEFGTATAAGSPEEEDFLGLPGLLDPDQVRTLLRKRQDSQLAARSKGASPPVTSPKTPDLTAAAFAPGSPAAAASRVSEVPMASGASAAASVPGLAAAVPGSASAAASAGASAAAAAAGPAAPPVSRQALAALRKELNGLVGAWSHRTNQPHGVIHNNLRQACGGPPLPQATADQIQARIDQIRRWAISGR